LEHRKYRARSTRHSQEVDFLTSKPQDVPIHQWITISQDRDVQTQERGQTKTEAPMNEVDLDQVASLAGLRHYPRQGPWGRKSGSVIGNLDGTVTIIGFNRIQKKAMVAIIIRFKKTEEPDLLKAAIAQSEAGAGKKRGKLAAAGTDFIRWEWSYSFTKPKAEEVVQLASALRSAILTVAARFDGHCEKCQRTSTSDLTLMDGLPIYICSGCQDAVRIEKNQAAANYESLQANYPNGLALGIGAAILGGIAWGVTAYALSHIFLYGAILIGYFISRAVLKGTGKVTTPAQTTIPFLTVGSILFGDAIFYTLSVMKYQDLSFSFHLLGAILGNLWNIEKEGDGVVSILFGLIGAGYALYAARKPKFKAVFEPLGTAGN
jgi:hypothetical protein